VKAALPSGRAVFGARVSRGVQLESAALHDWQRDPYARGAYGYVLANGGGARRVRARPVQDTVFVAGEAADVEGEAGTVAGALNSGLATARSLLRVQ
jgi:monoamine oxidase